MAKRQLNVWIAFADVAFCLFVAGLIGASGYRATAATALDRIKAAKAAEHSARERERIAELRASAAEAERARLRDELRRALHCANVQPLFRGLSSCLAQTIGADAAVRSDLCSMTLREDILRFETASDRPIDGRRARAVASCVYRALREFDRDHADAAEGIASISIDGYTDCEGQTLRNMRLGSARAATLFELILHAMYEDPARASSTEARLLSKLAIRSFGEQRPVLGSRCHELGQDRADRRVTIAVEMRPQPGLIARTQ